MKKWEKPMVQELDLCKTMATNKPTMACSNSNCCTIYSWNPGHDTYKSGNILAVKEGEIYYCRNVTCQLQGKFSLVEKINGVCS